MIDRAAKILEEPVCDHCLGRQYSQLLSGYANHERGKIIREAIALAIDSNSLDAGKIDPSNFHGFRFRSNKDFVVKKRKACHVCEGLFGNLGKWAKRIERKTGKHEFSTFLVGTRVSKRLLDKEEKLWEIAGIDYCEPLRAELNRELGKLIERELKKKADLKRPDISIIVDLERNRIELQVNPLYVFGYYNKLKRGFPQCRWGTPKKYRTSVEQIIGKPLLKAAKGKDHKFHGSGREDIDALCLGKRAFVIEIIEPKRRNMDLKKVAKEIKKSGKVEVFSLRLSDMDDVRRIKAMRPEKTYRALVILSKKASKKDLNKLKKLKGEVCQRTPIRVSHRRAELLRKRKVKSIKYRQLGPKRVEFIIRGTAGLYIKELVSGDEGRTRPSVAGLLGCKAEVKQLDVIKIDKII